MEGPDTPPPILRRGRAGSFNAFAAAEAALLQTGDEAGPTSPRRTISFGGLPPGRRSAQQNHPRQPSPLSTYFTPRSPRSRPPRPEDPPLPDILAPIPHSPPRGTGSAHRPLPRPRFVDILERAAFPPSPSPEQDRPETPGSMPPSPLPCKHLPPGASQEWIPDAASPFDAHELAVSAPALLMRGWRVITPPILARAEADAPAGDSDSDADEEPAEVPVVGKPAGRADGVDRVIAVLRSLLLLDGRS
ncbi:hypothetical protein DFJ74DRAFT_687719 [Hyaloraphidium curvatum]|nr:hypothetical protein DFJ74DRAFT_687719 [Hyaloraphidium curvatum]